MEHYEEGIKKGGILMGVKSRSADDAEALQTAWASSNGTDIYK